MGMHLIDTKAGSIGLRHQENNQSSYQMRIGHRGWLTGVVMNSERKPRLQRRIGCPNWMVLVLVSASIRVARSAEEHAFQLAKERGVSRSEVGLYDVFRRLHHPKGIASSQRALRIEENFQEQVQRLSQPQPGSTVPPKVNKSDVFIDVSKGKNKKRYFGLGNISKAFHRGESSQLSSQSSEDILKMKEEIKQLREGQEAQKEDIKQLLMEGREEMRAQMEEFCSRFLSTYRPPPSPPPSSA